MCMYCTVRILLIRQSKYSVHPSIHPITTAFTLASTIECGELWWNNTSFPLRLRNPVDLSCDSLPDSCRRFPPLCCVVSYLDH
jgi:hypothetical protein